jgi:hypothetical protein
MEDLEVKDVVGELSAAEADLDSLAVLTSSVFAILIRVVLPF